jgi:hypothetical protein
MYFREKSTCRLGCVKRTKCGAKNNAFCETPFVFFTLTIKIIVFRETISTHIDCRVVHAKLLEIF